MNHYPVCDSAHLCWDGLSHERENPTGWHGIPSPAIFISSGGADFDKKPSGGIWPFSLFSSWTSGMIVTSGGQIKKVNCEVSELYQPHRQIFTFEEIICFKKQEGVQMGGWDLSNRAQENNTTKPPSFLHGTPNTYGNRVRQDNYWAFLGPWHPWFSGCLCFTSWKAASLTWCHDFCNLHIKCHA